MLGGKGASGLKWSWHFVVEIGAFGTQEGVGNSGGQRGLKIHCWVGMVLLWVQSEGRLWDVRSGKIVQTLETNSSVTSAEVSQDGRYIITADGSSVKFWDANHFGLVKSYKMPCTVESASLEPKNGDKFIAGGEDMWIRLFDFHTGEEIACNKGHHGPVHCVRFSPGGESYASGSEDGTIRIWQTGPLTHDNNEMFRANGLTGKVKVAAEEVSCKIEGFHIADEGKAGEEAGTA
ncbi:Serine-threonine kinase receptor-associated protein [Vitis vinifera]|uniref:Serine-threonine kinase receptor-associated protein n=1 Tax=Vitis vinifera TaxID=29760 RepID=A0A438JPY2_VITVI|nr:Serine-threonine kinase receptor-associated protein [Vitis vinifera]